MAKLLKDLLLTAIEEENIQFQYLNDCMVNIKEKKRERCSEVSFMTKSLTPNDVMLDKGKVGIILWLDRDYIDKFNKG